MTINTITAQFDRIAADAEYTVYDNRIYLTIDDFGGFDENWSEIDREFENADAVEEVLNWLKNNADFIEDHYCRLYHFDNIVVTVGYTSQDI